VTLHSLIFGINSSEKHSASIFSIFFNLDIGAESF
jgi:hypothetical protein